MGDLQDHILDAMRSEGRSLADVERAADEAGVPHGQKASASQRAAILARLYGWSIESPAEVPSSPAEGASDPARSSDAPTTVAAEGVSPSSSAAPSPEALLDEAVRVAEAPTKPPKGRTIEEAIADAEKRAGKVPV